MNGHTPKIVPEYIVTMDADQSYGHLTKSASLDDAQIDYEKLRVAYPQAVLWRRDPDGKMTVLQGV